MRALVTGAAGFIGGHVVRTLADAGIEVIAYDRQFQQTGEPLPARCITAELLDRDSLNAAAHGCEVILHLAAVYSYARADAGLMERVNVEGTRTVLEIAVRTGCRRLVHTSSCATCGPVPGRTATELDLPPIPELRVPYKRTKLAGERLALAAVADGLEVVVVNPTVPVGPGDRRPTPTGKMVADVAHGRARAYLAGSALNVVAVEDVAAGHLLALERGRSGERYLLGGENLSIREVFACIATAAGRPVPRIGVPWGVAYAAALASDAVLRPLAREPKLLVVDEVRAGRLPHLFDDRKARAELGYVSRPARDALASAAVSALAQGAQR